MTQISHQWQLWLGFIIIIVALLVMDLLLFSGRRSARISTKEAFFLTIFWVILALLFNCFLWWYVREQQGIVIANQKALQFFTGYLLEKSLSIDNIFVFLLIFSSFSIPAKYQRGLLLQGVLGAIFMRAAMILAGIWLIDHFSWLFYVFGMILIISALKIIFNKDKKKNLTEQPLIQFLKRRFRVTQQLYGKKLIVKIQNKYYLTPLFLVLILIEVSDLIFAIDSIPAIFAITRDPFIVFTSNIFAILGLRALYFFLADVAERFYLMKYGIAFILIFIGIKMLIMEWIHIPIVICLIVIASILLATILLSLRRDRLG